MHDNSEMNGCKGNTPILLFCYNRLSPVISVINSLLQNDSIDQYKLYIYIDGPKNNDDQSKVDAVIKYLEGVEGFNEKLINKSEVNKGLAHSVIEGITAVVENHGRVIVLEDDIVVSKKFLATMEHFLDLYEDDQRIFHINGWTDPLMSKVLKEKSIDIYAHKVMHCWGWATWKDRWENFDKNPNASFFNLNPVLMLKLNDGISSNVIDQIFLNFRKKINTWAIFWFLTIYLKHKKCISFDESLCHNVGFGEDATHCKGLVIDQLDLSNKEYIGEDIKLVFSHKILFQYNLLKFKKLSFKTILKRCLKTGIQILYLYWFKIIFLLKDKKVKQGLTEKDSKAQILASHQGRDR